MEAALAAEHKTDTTVCQQGEAASPLITSPFVENHSLFMVVMFILITVSLKYTLLSHVLISYCLVLLGHLCIIC